ncbi:MAG: Rpn family recombination-promoting nuclease/putative transposase, partial [Bacillota bacterium]
MEQENQTFEDKWNNLTIADNFIFSAVMQDAEICKKVIELLLGFQIGAIKNQEIEKTIAITRNARGVRLDVYVKDEDKVYNIEMQVADKKNLPKRSRYYQGMIDLNTIQRGGLFNQLKESYVIFICTFDPFGKDLPIYTFENLCKEENGLPLNDGTYKLFFNATKYDAITSEDLKHFMSYVNGSYQESNPFTKQLNEKVTEIKTSDKWRVEFMTLDLLLKETEARVAKEAEARGEARG